MGPYPTGRTLWFELLCRDSAETRDFYAAVCNWTFVPWDMGNGTTYEMFAAGDIPIGALQPFPANAPAEHRANPHWLLYFSTQDVDASVAALRDLHGKVWVDPNSIPTVGRMAVVADRTAAEFAFFTPETQPPADPPMPAIGHVAWVECAVPSSSVALADYGALFGWSPIRLIEMGERSTYQIVASEGRRIGGFYQSSHGKLPPWRWMAYVRVADLEASYAKAIALGATEIMGPHDVPTGDARIAMLRDPEGAAFGLQWNE